jgi:hypothetical protein
LTTPAAAFLESAFPNLVNDRYVITSPVDRSYNCIAFAAGDTARKWWPSPTISPYYWPEELPRAETLDNMRRAFELEGYDVCADADLELGYEKVAIYAKDDAPTHAARQLSSGAWISKLGDAHDIEHQSVSAVEGAVYGQAMYYMRRPLAVPAP